MTLLILQNRTDLMEATLLQETKQIKDLLEEKNQSRDTLASGEFLKTLLLCYLY